MTVATGAYDHYAEARQVAAMREGSFHDATRSLEDAIAAGSGALRQSAKALHGRIDAALEQSG